MKFLGSLLLFLIPTFAQASVWDFYETGCTPSFGSDCLSSKPLAELILPMTESSSGSASWIGDGSHTPVSSGDPFILSFDITGLGLNTLSSTNLEGKGGEGQFPFFRPYFIVDYSLSWLETNGILNSISIDFLTEEDSVRLGLNGGFVGSDSQIGNCQAGNGTCRVTGAWQDPPGGLPVLYDAPEPSSFMILFGGVLLIIFFNFLGTREDAQNR